MRIGALGLVLLALTAGCVRRRAAAADPDAGAENEIVTPGGAVSPEGVKKQVEDTLEKEHERTMDPKVE